MPHAENCPVFRFYEVRPNLNSDASNLNLVARSFYEMPRRKNEVLNPLRERRNATIKTGTQPAPCPYYFNLFTRCFDLTALQSARDYTENSRNYFAARALLRNFSKFPGFSSKAYDPASGTPFEFTAT